jgi:hypothetical protein
MTRQYWFLIFLILTSKFAFSQTKNELWSRVLVNHSFNKKWSLDFDYNYRWQTDENNNALFSNKLLDAWRFVVTYRVNEHFLLNLTPISIWNSSGLILQEQDKYRLPSREKRWILNMEYILPINKSVNFQVRYGNEYRVFVNSESFRMRLRPLINYTSAKKQGLRVHGEILTNIYGNPNGFLDQYRATMDFTQPINKAFRILVGYTYNHRPKTSSRSAIDENIFLFTTALSI